MYQNIAWACICSMRIGFKLRHNVQFYRLVNVLDSQKHIKTVALDSNRLMCFRLQQKRISVDRALLRHTKRA